MTTKQTETKTVEATVLPIGKKSRKPVTVKETQEPVQKQPEHGATGELYTSAKAILAAASAQSKIDTESVDEWQKIFMSTVKHIDKHRDVTVIRNVLDKVLASVHIAYRVDSAKAYFDKVAPVRFDENGVAQYVKGKKTDMALAMSLAWWNARKPQEFKSFDFNAELGKLLDKASKLLQKPAEELKQHNIDLAQVNAARRLFKGGNTAKAA